jgi:hypothetical protein
MQRFMLTAPNRGRLMAPRGLAAFTKAGKFRNSKESFTSNCSELTLRFNKEDNHVNQTEEDGDIVYRVTARKSK